ncbi:hypothetical protein D9Q98_008791 [Chlorella vulgaris]|uniref:Fibronectin type-III domain-containing protein n=1 Tax=Chlorella vulgaris TaxID=3077 RepID=A0A9D4YUK2_CHLVU|nr:hypothetical protein D9Q98_008791 [Chlorella vulgaris]
MDAQRCCPCGVKILLLALDYSGGTYASGGTADCPRPALFFSLTLLGVKLRQDFTPAAKLAYKQALLRMAPGATIIPVAIDSEDLAQTVHTVALFPESVAGGVAAAQQLAVKLRAGGLNAYFDQRKFGRVHPEVVAEPYLADSTGDTVPSLPGSHPAGMITVAWYDYRPDQVTPQRCSAYVAAIEKFLPGAVVTYKMHVDDGDWTGAGGNAVLEKVSMDTVISNASPAALAQALNTIRTRPASVWPVAQFGQMAVEEGYAVRWVPHSSFVSPCDVRTTLKLTGILALTPTCNRQTTAAYLATLKASLPGDAVTTVVSATRVSSGCQIVTSTSYPNSRHASVLALAGRLVKTPYPLSGTSFGATSRFPAFLIAGEVVTGKQRNVVTSKFVLLISASAIGQTSGKGAAFPVPGDSFVKYMFKLQPAQCQAGKSCAPLTFTSDTATPSFRGLTPSTTYNVTVTGISQAGTQTRGLNQLQFATPAGILLRLTGAKETSPTSGTATVTASPGVFTKYIFTVRKANCPAKPCPVLTFTRGSLTSPLTGLEPGTKYNVTVEGVSKTGERIRSDNWVPLVMPPGLLLTKAVATGNTTGAATVRTLPAKTFIKYVFTVVKANCFKPPCASLTFTSTSRTAQFTGLASGTRYNVTVSGVDKAGSITKGSNMLQFKTPTPALPIEPGNGSTEPVNSTSAIVRIIAPSSLQCSSFKIRLCPINPAGPTCTVQACPTTLCQVSGLFPGTTYSVTVLCLTGNGNELANTITGGTVTTLPELAVESADATGPYTGTATADPSPNSWPFTKYTFTLNEASCASCPPLTFTSNSPTVAFTGLKSDTTYTVTVVGADNAGTTTEGSNMKQFTTSSSVGSTEAVNGTSGIVDIIASGGLQCVRFKVRLCPIKPPSSACVLMACAATPRCAVSGLSPGTTYSVTVVCVLEGGTSVSSPGTSTLTTPPELILTGASATGLSTGTATADPDPSSAFTLYTFTLKQASCPSCPALTFTSSTPRGAFVGLSPLTQYNVTVVGTGINGIRTPGSNMKQFKTPAAPPPPPPSDPSIDPIEPGSATATSGFVDINPGTNLQCASCRVKLCPVKLPSTTCIFAACTSTRCRVTGLSPGTVYSVTVVCLDANGNVIPPESSPVLLTTAPGFNLTSASATSPFRGAASAVAIPADVFVVVLFTLRDVSCPACPPLTFNGTTLLGAFTGLTSATTYNVTAVGVDAAGTATPSSNWLPFTTPAASPPPSPRLPSPSPPRPAPSPVNPAAIASSTASSPTSGVVQLTAPVGITCTSYIVELCPVPPPGGACVNTSCPTTSCAVTGLTAGTTYKVSAVCVDSSNTQVPASNTGTLTTPPTLSIASAGATSSVAGTATASPSSSNPFVSYNFTVVEKSCGSCPALVFTSSSPTVPLTGLTPNTTYNVTVVGINSSGAVTPGTGWKTITTPSIPAIASCTASSPTSGVVQLTAPVGITCTAYIVELCPVPPPGGACVNTSCPTTSCAVTGLTAGTSYKVSAVCVDSSNTQVPASNTGTLTTPPSLSIASAGATSSVAGTATASPSSSNPFVSYNFTVVDKSCGSCPALVFTSSSPTVPLTGLTPNTTYNVTVVGINSSGAVTPGTGWKTFTTDPLVITLVSAVATSLDSGNASAAIPAGGTFTNYTFTARPLSGGPNVTVTSSSLDAGFRMLLPLTTVCIPPAHIPHGQHQLACMLTALLMQCNAV